jgi:prefoldin alpha subunit
MEFGKFSFISKVHKYLKTKFLRDIMEEKQILNLQKIEVEIEELNQQLQIIDQNILELNEIKESLLEIENSEKEEFLINLGKKIYLPVKIKEKKIIAEVGDKTFVKKSIDSTIKTIEEQNTKLNDFRREIKTRLNHLQREIEVLIKNVEEKRKDKKE